MVTKLTREWWRSKKQHYVFDKKWFEAFEQIDPELKLPIDPDKDVFHLPESLGKMEKMGIVFLHKEDGQTIIPVGITIAKIKSLPSATIRTMWMIRIPNP
jgi:hypothetical protein